MVEILILIGILWTLWDIKELIREGYNQED